MINGIKNEMIKATSVGRMKKGKYFFKKSCII